MMPARMKNIVVSVVLAAAFAAGFCPRASATNINCGVEIIEINHDDDVSNTGYEWIKLQNRTGRTINISSWKVGDDDTANMTLAQETGWGDITAIPDGATFVICEPASSGKDFAVRYASFKSLSNYLARASGNWGFSTSGDKVRISSTTESGDSSDIQRFTFYAYDATSNKNKTLVKISFSADEDSTFSWRPGAPGGSPFALYDISKESFDLKVSVDSHPFDPTNYEAGVINFETSNSVVKTIYIFNIYGREVARLVDADTSMYGSSLAGIGKGSIRWNGRDKSGAYVSSGIYVVCLEAASGTDVRRVKSTIAVGKFY